MPTLMDPAVEALANNHRAAQLRNAVVAGWLVRRRWVAAVAGGQIPEGLMADLVATILTYRSKAGLIAVRYGSVARRQALGDTRVSFTPQLDVPLEKFQVSLGAVAFHPANGLVSRIANTDDPTARRALLTDLKALSARAGNATMRHVGDAGRDTVKDIARNQDGQALGYVRVTKPGCCYFCAMLASRGPVYDEGSFEESNEWFEGDGPSKVHDSCNCSLAIVYSDAAWPARSARLAAEWQPGMSVNEWRKYYDENLRDTLL